MSEAAQTLDGWYALHDFRTIDWTAWKSATAEERETAKQELLSLIADWQATEERKEGSLAMYAIVGQKADFVFMHLRETLEELNAIENAFNRSAFAKFVKPEYSYVSIVELSSYLAPPGSLLGFKRQVRPDVVHA